MGKRWATLSFLFLVAISVNVFAAEGDQPAAPAAPAATAPAATAPAAPAMAAPETTAPAAPAATAPAVAVPAVPAAPATPAVAAPAAPSINLSGKWSSKITDKVVIEQAGDKITGTYSYVNDDKVTLDGKIEGTIEGNTVKGKWYERPKVGKGEETRGTLEWKVVENGKMLVGWFKTEGEKGKEDWNLER